MRVLVGLGNPGLQYEKTRHNVGFVLLDALARAEGLTWKQFKGGELAEYGHGEKKAFLFKPMQYMNESGRPLQQLLAYYSIEPQDVCVVADEVYIHPGSARMRHSGGDAGHNGIKSIIENIGTGDFWRVKIGVGLYEQDQEKRQHLPPLDEYVLQKLPAHDQKRVEALIDIVTPNLVQWLRSEKDFEVKTFHAN